MIWEKKLELPYNEEAFNSIVKAVKSMQSRLIAITYIYDLNVLDGKVYLLTKKIKGKPQLIVKVNSEGDTNSIYALHDSAVFFTSIALDREREGYI